MYVQPQQQCGQKVTLHETERLCGTSQFETNCQHRGEGSDSTFGHALHLILKEIKHLDNTLATPLKKGGAKISTASTVILVD